MASLHVQTNEICRLAQLGRSYLEDEFVVNLQQHRGVELRVLQSPVDSHHRQLHQICGTALQRCVGRFPLGRGAQHVVTGS